MKTVVLLLIGDIGVDGRVQKEIASLRGAGFRVTLIQWSLTARAGNHAWLGIDTIEYLRELHPNAIINFARQLLFNLFALRHLKRLAPDVVQCNDLNTLLAGCLFRRRARIVYDAHELFPESQSGFRKTVWTALERWMVRGCSAYIQPEIHRLTYFAQKYDIPPARIALVENFPSTRSPVSSRNLLREYFDLPHDAVVALCPGVLGPGRNIENMIESMRSLDGRFVLVLLGPAFKGYGNDLVRQIRAAGVEDRVKVHPAVPNIAMLDYIHSSDIGLVFYPNTNLNNYWCASNKLYDFIYCGKPVVTNDYPGLRSVVEDNRLGLCIGNSAPGTIAAAVEHLSSTWTRPPTAPTYVWERQEAAYLRLFE